jgi:hypothetical protein
MATPVLISSAYANGLGVQLAPVIFRGAYYVPLTNAQAGSGTLSMFKSTDGVTWVNVGDVLTGIVNSAFTTYFDGSFFTCLVEVSTGGGEIVIVVFDCNSGTWGSPFGAIAVGAGTSPLVNQVVKRPDGSIVGTSPNKFWVWNGATWTSFPILTNIPAGFVGGNSGNTVFQVDAAGTIHSVTLITSPGDTEQAYFYQQFTLSNTLGNFAALTSILFPAVNFGLIPSNVVVNQTRGFIAFAALDNSQNARVFVGQTLASPLWSLSAAIDPTVLSTDFGVVPTLTNYQDGRLFLLHPETDDQTFIEFATVNMTVPTTGWSQVQTVVAPSAMTIFENNWQATADAGGSVFFTEEIPPGFTAESFFALGGPLPPPPPPPPPAPTIVNGPMMNGYPTAGVIALPDAGVKCDVNGRKRCVYVKGPRPPMQR